MYNTQNLDKPWKNMSPLLESSFRIEEASCTLGHSCHQWIILIWSFDLKENHDTTEMKLIIRFLAIFIDNIF